MSSSGAIRPRAYLLLALPALVAVAAIAAEIALTGGGGVSRALDERLKKVIEMDTDLAKWFIGLGMTLVGATAYYVRARPGELAPATRFSRVAIVLTVVGSVVSIFFGHLWLSNMRSMVVNDYFEASSGSLVWPERIQYLSFLASLCWFALLVVERETSPRPPAAQVPGPQQVVSHAA